MKRKPLVSICMPVYNGEEDVEKAINSILKQTHQNFEVIISDNGSKDKTVEKIKQFKDKRIFFSRNKQNIGWRLNSNKVLKAARGKYVVTLHDDDFFFNNYLERVVSIFEKYPNVGIIHCVTPEIRQKYFYNKMIMNPAEYYSCIASLRCVPAPTVTAYRGEVLKGTGYYSKDRASGEARLSLEIAKKGYDVYFEGRLHCKRYEGIKKGSYDKQYLSSNFWDPYNFYKDFKNDARIKKKDINDLKDSIVHLLLILYNYNLKWKEKEIRDLFRRAEKDIMASKDFEKYKLKILTGKFVRFVGIKTKLGYLYKLLFKRTFIFQYFINNF